MSWWEKLRTWMGGEPPAAEESTQPPTQPSLPAVSWLAADQSRFGVPVLDLTPITRGMRSTSQSQEAALKAISWSRSVGEDLSGDISAAHTHPCTLRYPAAADLPEGLLYTPRQMEDKWVIAWRGGQIRMARSWTGTVVIVADARHEGESLVVTGIRATEDSPLEKLGDPVETFDWMMRAHALAEVVPLPVSAEGARQLQETPLVAFSLYGQHALCAAKAWSPPPPERPLRSNGAVLRAVRSDDPESLRQLAADGLSLSPPSTVAGYTPLHAALLQGSEALTDLLLTLGADPNILADQGASVLGIGLIHKAPQALLERLIAHGADPHHANDNGFNLLHSAAEADRADLIPWLLSLGLDLESTTRHGHAPLHIAAALGSVATIEALLAAGARPDAPSPGGTPRAIAEAEGKPESIAALDRHGSGE